MLSTLCIMGKLKWYPTIGVDPQFNCCVTILCYNSYKNNYRSEGICYANARTKVIIFCKSCPLNWN